MRRTLLRSAVIVLAGVACGLLANVVSPRGIPFITPPKPTLDPKDTIPLADAFQLWGSGAGFFLDARAPADYAAGHIAGAFNLPAEAFNEHFPQVAGMLTPATPITVYCDGVECELSHRCAGLLRQHGYTNVLVLVNGWTLWRGAGYPTSAGANP